MEDIIIGDDKKRAPTWCKLCRVAALLLLALRILGLIGNLCGYSLLIGTLTQSTVYFVADGLLLAAAVGSIHFTFKPSYFLPAVIAVIILAIYATNLFSYTGNIRYRSFASPQETTTLVLKEDGSLFSGTTRFYERRNSFFIKDTGERVSLDDGYQLVGNSELKVSWTDEKTAVFSYYEKESGELLLEKVIVVE